MTTEQQLPEGWKKTTLGAEFEWSSGGTPKSGVPAYYENGSIHWLNISDLNDGLISYAEKKITELGLQESSAKIVPQGSVLIAIYGSIGKLGINTIPLATNQAICFTKKIPEYILNKFLFYYLLSIRNQLISMGKGGTQQNISQTVLKSVPFFYPTSKETQQAIVNKIESLFDEIDEGIGRLKTAAQQIQQYRQSLLKNAFNGELTKEWRSKHADALPSENELLAQIQTTREQHHAQQLADWQNITIGEVVTISPKKEKAIDDDTDVSFSSMHLMSSSLSEHLTYEIKKWADVKKGFTVFRNNDVLLAKITPCFENGKSAVAQDLINGIGTGSTEFMVLRSSNQILPKFLYFLVNTPDFRQAGIHNMTGSVGHKRVPKDFVSTWAFSLPPLAEQTEIVAILESKLTACDQLADELAKQLKQAEMLKQAVLKAAFSGGLLDK